MAYNLGPKLYEYAFREWLEGLESDESVGLRQVNDACPIVSFLAALGYEAYVGSLGYEIGSLRVYYELPEWAYNFVAQVDSSGDFGTEVMAGEALAILTGS